LGHKGRLGLSALCLAYFKPHDTPKGLESDGTNASA
jgi:hypothetical protein